MAVQAPSRWATDDDFVANLLARIRTWKPLDGAALLDDVAAVLDDVPLSEEDVEDAAERLRGHLMQLVNIAISSEADQKSGYADTLIHRARALRAEEMSGDHRRAVQHLRQMGWVTSELLDQLVGLDSTKEAA
jgi:hypothetical protein